MPKFQQKDTHCRNSLLNEPHTLPYFYYIFSFLYFDNQFPMSLLQFFAQWAGAVEYTDCTSAEG